MMRRVMANRPEKLGNAPEASREPTAAASPTGKPGKGQIQLTPVGSPGAPSADRGPAGGHTPGRETPALSKRQGTDRKDLYPPWAFDSILDGLISGKISGRAVNRADAHLLVDLLIFLEWQPSASHIAGAIPYLIDRLGKSDLRRLMENLGFRCVAHRMRGRQMRIHDKTATVVLLENKLWRLETCARKTFCLTRPASDGEGQVRREIQPFQSYDLLFCSSIHPENEQEIFGPHRSFITDLFASLARESRTLIVLSVLTGVLTILFSIAVIFLFNLVVSGQEPEVISAVLIAVAAVFAVDLGFRALKARMLGRIAASSEYRVGTALFDKLVKLPRKMIDQAPISEQAVRLRELEGLRDLFSSAFLMVLLELPVSLMLIATIAAFSPLLAFVLLGVIAIFFLLGICLVPAVARGAADLSAARRALLRLQMEAIENGSALSRNGLAWPWMEKANRICAIAIRARFRLARATSLLETVSYLSVPVCVASVIFLGAVQVVAGNLTGGVLIAATMLTWRVLAPIQQGLVLLPKVKDLLRLFLQIDTIMKFPSEEAMPNIARQKVDAMPLQASNIVLKGAKSNVPALAAVTLTVPAGMLVTVGGASGAGKSALLGVLAGQIKPQAGNVHLGSNCLTALSSSTLGRRIMLVPSDAPLIYGTLAQNLRFAEPLADHAEIRAVLDEVGLGPLVERLPHGIDSRIDPMTDKALLSGGVRTAVAVAQALLISPAVLMIDEASEDVDPRIETAIFSAVKKRRGQMTTLLVTHRPSVVRASDAMIELANGRARLRNIQNQQDVAV